MTSEGIFQGSPRRILNVIVASFAIFGVIEAFAPETDIVHLVILSVPGFAWCKADVRARQRRTAYAIPWTLVTELTPLPSR